MRAAIASIVLVVCAALARAADPPDVLPPQARIGGAVVTTPRVRIGEPFDVVLTARVAEGTVVRLPDDTALKLDPFEIVGRAEGREDEGDVIKHELILTVVAWELGALTFPSVPLEWVAGDEHGVVETGPLAVEVEATVPQAAAEEPPADIAPPVAVTRFDQRLVWVAAGVVGAGLLALVVWLLSRALRRRRVAAGAAEVVVDTRPPEEIALAKLRALRESGLADRSDRRPFYFALTEIEREFLGRRFGFDALEMTTSELMDALALHAAPEPLQRDIRRWLEACDLVKYAGVPATRDEAERALDAAVALVEQAKPPPPAPAVATEEVQRAG